jgi:hypothetical protein
MKEKKPRNRLIGQHAALLFALFFSGMTGSMPAFAIDLARDGKAPVQSSVKAPNVADAPADLGDDVSIVSGEGGIPIATGHPGVLANSMSRTATETELNAMNVSRQSEWKANFNDKTGKVKLLYGFLSKSYGEGPEKTARGFLAESSALFGIRQDLSDLKTVRVDETPERDHVRFQQTHNGVPVVGAFVIVHANKNRQVTMVQNGHTGDIVPGNSDVITEAAAREIVLTDLRAALKEGSKIGEGKSEKLLFPQGGTYVYVWQVTIPTGNPFGLWVYRVDAESGKILYKADEILAQTGKGRVFASNANWHLGKVSTVSLKYLYTSGNDTWGFNHGGGGLFGTYVDALDNFFNNPYSSTYKFLYDPVSQPDWFNTTQAYYAVTTAHDWWATNIIKKYGPNPTASYFYNYIPVVTNITPVCNAYYSSNLFGLYGPGIAFGPEDACAPGSANLVQDWDVVRHEYTHAMMDWNNFNAQFSSPLNYYGRAMGEGNADWFSFLPNKKDPFVGDVAWDWSPAGYLRTLDNTRMYPYDVNLDSNPSGLPEEHYTGEIWGNYLYDLTKNLGANALKYVYQSFFYFEPSGGFQSSYPDFFDAIRAQVDAEYDHTGKYTNSLKAWGSMASRGLNSRLRPVYSSANYFNSGASGSDSIDYFGYIFPYFKSISTKANLLYSHDPHDYTIYANNAGMKLTVTVTGSTKGMTNPVIYLYDGSNTLIYTGTTTSATKATLTYAALPAGFYTVRVSGVASAPARGYYGIKISMK